MLLKWFMKKALAKVEVGEIIWKNVELVKMLNTQNQQPG